MDAFFTVEQAAATMRLSPQPLKGRLRVGKLTGCKTGRQWRVREVGLETFIQACQIGHVSVPTGPT